MTTRNVCGDMPTSTNQIEMWYRYVPQEGTDSDDISVGVMNESVMELEEFTSSYDVNSHTISIVIVHFRYWFIKSHACGRIMSRCRFHFWTVLLLILVLCIVPIRMRK